MFALALALLLPAAHARKPPPPPPVTAPAPAPDPAAVLAGLSFLTGHWRGPLGPDTIFDATYTTSDGGLVLSASRTIEAGQATSYEFERFAVVDGVVTLTPFPGGKETVSFRYVPAESAPGKAVFTNPKHDFPTELTYALVAPARLVITLSGKAAGSADVMVFDLAREP
ncbi:MAG: DUF6265 family protein [Myxococcota bacterium]